MKLLKKYRLLVIFILSVILGMLITSAIINSPFNFFLACTTAIRIVIVLAALIYLFLL